MTTDTPSAEDWWRCPKCKTDGSTEIDREGDQVTGRSCTEDDCDWSFTFPMFRGEEA